MWIFASTRERFVQAYKDIARRRKLPGWDDPKIDTLQLVTEWLSDPTAGKWLMILDNADDPDVFFTKQKSSETEVVPTRPLINYLPEVPHGSILATTRDSRMGKRLGSKNTPVVVGYMDLPEGQELLRSHLNQADSLIFEDSKALIDALGYIPLAITQAAAFIEQNSMTIAEYLEILNANDSDLQDLLQEDSGDLRRDSESQNSVFRTWKLSFDLIVKQKPRAAEILSLMSVFDRQGIPRCLLQANTDGNVDTTTALGTLQAYSLISRQAGAEKYDMHRLIQLATQKWLQVQGTSDKWQERALKRLSEVFPHNSKDLESWAACDLLLPHAQKVLENDYADKESLLRKVDLLSQWGVFDIAQGRYEAASIRHSVALDLVRSIRGMEDPKTLNTMEHLAIAYVKQGRWKEAEKLQLHVLETRSRVLQVGDKDILDCMNNLAFNYSKQGRWEEAERLQIQVMNTSLKILEAEHPDTLGSMNNLANTYSHQGRWKEAEKLQIQVMNTTLRLFRAEHPVTLVSTNNLASIYNRQGRFKEAEKLQLRVLETLLRVLKADHPDTLSSMENLAVTFGYQQRSKEAEKLQIQVLETRTRVLKSEHPSTLNGMYILASIYWDQGRHSEAIELMKDVVDRRTKHIGANHSHTLESVKSLEEMNRRLRLD